jgi:TonB-linked SusC/RagA family outer membrane protein
MAANLSELTRRFVALAAMPVLLAFFAVSGAEAQQGAVAGQVIDAQSAQPVTGAQVTIPGTEIGILTDANGRYRLTGVPTGPVEVRVRLIGYSPSSQTVTVEAGQTATANFELTLSAVELEELTVDVLTGRERRRLELGTNVGEIDVEEVNQGPITNFSDLLAGRAEGVTMQDVSGDIGSSQRIRIRGASSLSLSNDPLVIVDGIRYSASNLNAVLTGGQEPSRLNDLNPEDIQSIEVVKGPAASALYGAVGANGVLIVTTRRGSSVGATDWRFYAQGGVLEQNADFPLNYEAVQLAEGGDPGAPFFTESGFNSDDWVPCSNVEAAEGLCEQEQFLSFNTLEDARTSPFQTGDNQTYGMNVSGGSQEATYFLSGELEKEVGVVKFDFNYQDRVSGRANLDAALRENLDVSLSVGYLDSEVGFVNNDNSIFSVLINGLCGTAGFVPGEHPENGGPNPQNFCFFRNLQDLGEASLSTQETDRFTTSLNTNWRATDWLTAQGTFGLDLANNFDFITIQPGLDNLAASWVRGFRQAYRPERHNWTANASLSANFDVNPELTSTTTVGGQYQEELLNAVGCYGEGIVPGTQSCSTSSASFSVFEDYFNEVQIGAYLQQELGWRDRLFLTGSVRLDDNSNFGNQVDMQLYPSVNASYVLSQEDWFPSDGVISELRLRGAYGEAGVLPGFNDAITLFEAVTATRAGNEPGVTLDETGNPDLEPERSKEIEGGVDVGLFNDRVGLGLTYFNKRSEDALISREIPPSFGLTTSFFQNLGEIRNRGFEMSLQALALDMEDARADFTLQFSTLENEVVELGEGVEPINFGSQRHQEGFSPGAYFQQPYTFEDENGDGLIAIDEVTPEEEPDTEGLSEEEERLVLGEFNFIDESIPTWTVSLNADIELFQFLRLNTLFDARGGHSQNNFTEAFRCQQFAAAGLGCAATAAEDASLEEQARFVASRFHGTNAGYIEDATFLKWRELSLTLTAPPSLRDVHPLLERSTLTLSGRNLATWTDYSGLDPEVQSSGNANFSQFEFNTQPPLQHFTARVDIRF